MITVIFESHGTTLDNEAQLSSGWYDVELSELGRRQAEELGMRYAGEHFDAIFCSDLRRAHETAQIAFVGRDIPIIEDKRLRECNYGDLTRQASEKVERLKGTHVTTPFPHGQSYEQTTDAIRSFLQELLQKYNDKKVMIIGHRATQYGLEHLIKGVSLKEAVTAPWQWQPGWTYRLDKI